MANKPDLGDLTKKLNIGGLVDNVKSLISPTGATPDPEEGDKIGHQLAELSLLVQELSSVNSEQAKRMAKINKLFNDVFNELKAEREGLEEAVKAAAEPAEGTDEKSEKPTKPKKSDDDAE